MSKELGSKDTDFGPYPEYGLMAFPDYFEPEPFNCDSGECTQIIQFKTSSGPQRAASKLEGAFLEQIAFLPYIFDVMAKPSIKFGHGQNRDTFVPAVVLQLDTVGDDLPLRYVIDIRHKGCDFDTDDAAAERTLTGIRCAEWIGAVYRMIDERAITTPFLKNARRLTRRLKRELTRREEIGFDILCEKLPLQVSEGIALLGVAGYSAQQARKIIENTVAWRRLATDLSLPFTGTSVLHRNPIGFRSMRADPLLNAIETATIHPGRREPFSPR